MSAFIFFLFAFLVIGIFTLAVHTSKKLKATWSGVAQELALFHHDGGFFGNQSLSGEIDGCLIIVETYTRGSGKNSSRHTRYLVNFPASLEYSFTLTKQGFFSGISKAFGAQDIEVGDPAFDNVVILKGNDPAALIRFLTPIRREKIQYALMEFNDLTITDSGIRSETPGQESSREILIRKVHRMVEFARFLSHHQLPARPSATTPPPLPAPPSPPPLPQPEPTPQPLPEPPPHTNHLITASLLGESLFTDHTGISEIDRIFETNFLGRTIQGSGTLRSWRPSSFDFVFGPGKYIKATVEIPIPNATTHGRKNFQTVIQLPPDTPSPTLGTDFTFQGELLKIDPLMRTVFVRNI